MRKPRTKSARSLRAAALAATALLAPCAAMAFTLPAGSVGYSQNVDYSKPNFANSPNLHKFVDGLPGLGFDNRNALNNYIPVAVADKTTYPGADYYEIGLRMYTQQMHSDLPNTTKLRGYYQKTIGDQSSHYLGPLIIAERHTPVRIKFTNELPTGSAGNLPLPVDTNIMGAGMGPLTNTNPPAPCDPMMSTTCATYSQNRANIHLHGGLTPWISDGTPHQWITPAGETSTPFLKGASFQNVPDMVGSIQNLGASDGTATYYYPNEQSARLMFYHDHSYGITRLNVYAGEAAGYLLVDQAERDLISQGILPNQAGLDKSGNDYYHYGIPLIIQDKTFVNGDAGGNVPQSSASATPTALTKDVDPNWFTLLPGSLHGDLWFPHEYMPNEDLYNLFPGTPGMNPMGRWDYAPWMIPPMVPLKDTLPSPTIIPEAYGDTPLVNGAAFPYLQLQPTAYRFRILNACNDRMLNLQLYYAATKDGVVCKPDANGIAPDPSLCTEVSMVPASNYTGDASHPNWPATWPKDGRDGGVPDWNNVGPTMIQVGNEGGFLVKPAIIPPQPIDFDYNRRSVTFGGVTSKALLMPPAVRADIVVDFSSAAPGSTLILYNDAPAPMPLFDSRNDYFTGSPDQTSAGGAPMTEAGLGPNTRTVMQFRIDPGGTPAAAYNLAALQTALPQTFKNDQDNILVPQVAYNAAYPVGDPLHADVDIYANAVDDSLNTTGKPQTIAKVVTTAPGLGYTKAPTVKFSGGGCTGYPTATATLNGITGITLVTAGSGYVTAPAVNFSGGGGKGATAVATISGGVVTVITVTNPGSGYTKAPTVTLSGGGAVTQATATATITLGSIGSITLTNPNPAPTCLSAPQVSFVGGGGTGATAAAILTNGVVLNGKNLVEGFDMEYGRMNAVLGSTPNPLAPTVGAGPVVGANFYIDPPTEILNGGQTVLWRLSHIGVDSHAIHFHLFNVQVVNRVDWTNTIKPPYDDELGWKETIRTNPFEDIIVAIKPVGAAMKLPFALPDSNRLLDPTMLAGTAGMFQPVAPPPGLPAVAQTLNVMTNFGWEYVWHCHLLGHEENDMMRPIVFHPDLPHATVGPNPVNFGTVNVGRTKTLPVTVTNTGLAPLTVSSFAINPTTDFSATSNCSNVAAGGACTINVVFLPKTTGTKSATLTVNDNSDGVPSSQQVTLTGSGK